MTQGRPARFRKVYGPLRKRFGFDLGMWQAAARKLFRNLQLLPRGAFLNALFAAARRLRVQ
jgi:hypothetical protein